MHLSNKLEKHTNLSNHSSQAKSFSSMRLYYMFLATSISPVYMWLEDKLLAI